MKNLFKALAVLALTTGVAQAQMAPMQFYRYHDQRGINTFEPSKTDTLPYAGLAVRIGGGFEQDYQMLDHKNASKPSWVYTTTNGKTDSSNANQLASLTNGFNLAFANMYIDGQLEDGMRISFEMYLASRHHNETWVKNGYLQIDKLPFLKSQLADDIMKNFTLKVGALEVDYGDAHYRRSDGGNAVFNPFVENYIMDEFATEVGAEVYYHPLDNGLIVMVGATDAMLNPTVIAPANVDAASHDTNTYNPSIHFKVGYDKQLTEDVRVRLTGSYYLVSSTSRNTMFYGDRTGSKYFYALENSKATSKDQAWSGRFDPSFSDEVGAMMINPFVKVGGLEIFGTYEQAKGRMVSEVDKRTATQIAADVLYRFGGHEEFWVGGRYNSLKAQLPGKTITDVKINRTAFSAGWFMTKSVLTKLEYVMQKYDGFADKDIRNGAEFSGLVIQAALSF